jgi:hypothetical protein
VKLAPGADAEAFARLERSMPDYLKEKPVSDEVFAALRGLFAYDETALDAKVEETQTTEDWKREKVSFKEAAGNDRLTAQLFLPVKTPPPYQTVIYFPGSNCLFIEKLEPNFIKDGEDFLPKSGRALMIPVYRGTFERRDGLKGGAVGGNPPGVWRDHVIAWAREVGRALDYVGSRKDLDGARTAYMGYSLGGALSPVLVSMNPRLRASVIWSGGLWGSRALPECDPFNFLPRVRTPTVLIGGTYDFAFPLDESQVPFFRGLGVAEKDKKHVIVETGHAPPLNVLIKETLDWLDTYLGPVKG